jgi:hypothetical protein
LEQSFRLRRNLLFCDNLGWEADGREGDGQVIGYAIFS